MSTLLRLPAEVLYNIALFLVSTRFLGPPSCLVPLLLTCSQLNKTLSPVRNPFYGIGSRIFRQKFDSAAICRRQPRLVLTSDLYVNQLIRYCNALRVVRTGNIDHEDAYEALWVCFLMMLEDDGRNGAQIREWANARSFVRKWINQKLYVGGLNGWPLDSNENGLALWIYWQITQEEDIVNESPEERKDFIDVILPFVIMSYRYPSIHSPPNHFRFPIKEVQVLFPTLADTDETMTPPEHSFPYSLITVHGAYPLYLNPDNASVVYDWWGLNIPFSHITSGTVSKLLYFARRDQFGPVPGLPSTRAEAESMGRSFGITQEDMDEIGSFRSTVLPFPCNGAIPYVPERHDTTIKPFQSALNPYDPAWDSGRWDIDWIRWTSCYDPRVDSSAALGPVIPCFNSRPGRAGLIERRTLTPRRECYDIGSMAGLWQGKMILPAEDCHLRLLMAVSKPADLSEETMRMSASALYMRLREFHSITPNQPIAAGSGKDIPLNPSREEVPINSRRVDKLPEFDDGAQNAWFPWEMNRKTTRDSATLWLDGVPYDYVLHTTLCPSSRAHDPRICPLCLEEMARVAERERKRKEGHVRTLVQPYEHIFQHVGLDQHEEQYWDVGPEEWMKHEGEECSGVTDIIFIGETDQKHGIAWGPYIYYGRIRRWDGLIGLLRVSLSSGLAPMFFYGYLVGGRNFVGTWRMAYEEMGIPAWECAFSMSKREDD